MSILDRMRTAIQAAQHLGVAQVGLFAAYQLALRSGYLAWRTRSQVRSEAGPAAYQLQPVLRIPEQGDLLAILDRPGIDKLQREAEEIVAGKVRLFGGRAQPLRLVPPQPQPHWTAYERHPERWLLAAREALAPEQPEDVKFIWEPGRFSWAFILGRAYRLSGDERYAETFWQQLEDFLDANPPYYGPQWVSAQEVALRLLALVFAGQVFGASPESSPERKMRLARAVADHAGRIPPSLWYARAQNNNHLLSEAAGLLTAGLALPGDRRAAGWRALGEHWFWYGLEHQIAADGTYVQHSANYHRLMLQLALWCDALERPETESLHEASRERLAQATGWLLDLLDRESGGLPNLGPNDGAYIFPLAAGGRSDFRPVLQAAGEHFLGVRPFPPGPWDEMIAWFPRRETGGAGADRPAKDPLAEPTVRLLTLRPDGAQTWAYLRAARFESRPGHADQLHLDLWWRGINLAQDAGTYLYNAPPPWDNALAHTGVHNTLTLEGRDQMRRTGRFLWLDWAQAEVLEAGEVAGDQNIIAAQHDGYQALGLLHRRDVTWCQRAWRVVDWVLPDRRRASGGVQPVEARLHWLLPDWEWSLTESGPGNGLLKVRSPFGLVRVELQAWRGTEPMGSLACELQVVRAGQLLHGRGVVEPSWGWVSPTYGEKLPALSLALVTRCVPPLKLETIWHLPAS